VTDPRDQGARCDVCPLARGGAPVAPVMAEGIGRSRLAIVGEAPGPPEVEQGRPFVGPSGIEEGKALAAAGWQRTDFRWTEAVACKPPGNGDLNLYLQTLQSRNRRRKRNGQTPLPSPIDCCAPRLQADLVGAEFIISLGTFAAKAVIPGMTGSVLPIRGGPVRRDDGVKVLPTLHPSFVLRAPRWREAYRIDHERARRWADDRLTWQDPQILYRPSVQQLAAYLGVVRRGIEWVADPAKARPLAWDYETDGVESLDCSVRCIGIGTAGSAVVVPFLSVDGHTRFYPEGEEHQINAVLRAWMVGPGLKIGHNSGYYDTLVAEQHLRVTPHPQVDTILLHRLVKAELPHSLQYLGSTLTDVIAWKAGKEATTATEDADLWLYNARDVAVTARCAVPLVESVTYRGLGEVTSAGTSGLLGGDHEIQRICRTLHRNGMLIDQQRREEFLVEYQGRLARWTARCMEAPQKIRDVWRYESKTRQHPFNPGSGAQVARLLYEDWGLEPTDFTASGDPSVADTALRKLLGQPLDPEQIAFVRALRQYRKAAKVVGTYLLPAAPPAPGQRRGERQGDYKGWLRPNGRVHADWKAHVVVSGRLGSSPNMQNVPVNLRSMFVPQPGFRLVYADADQLELRIAAARWGASRYLEAFDRGDDPHQVTMHLVFGEQMWDWDGGPPKAHRWKKKWPGGKIGGHFSTMRDLAKRVQYAGQYGAATPTVHDVITSAEDKDGELIYADLSLSEVRTLHEAWLEGCPEFTKGWDSEMAYFHRHRYVRDDVGGRVRDCLDGDELNTVVNFPIQAAGAAIINAATLRIDAMYPCGFAGAYSGLINQCHDALTLEVPEAIAERVAADLQAAMSGTTTALPGVEFKAEAVVKTRWED
jgi:DNA polymerase I-like protein with 3'-5' exonuclease and polymerase domains/uracil-DNA glycosylase